MILFNKGDLLKMLDDYGINQSTTDIIDNAIKKYKDKYGEDDKSGMFSDFYISRVGSYVKIAEKWHLSKTTLYKKLDYVCDKIIAIINNDEKTALEHEYGEVTAGLEKMLFDSSMSSAASMPDGLLESFDDKELDRQIERLHDIIALMEHEKEKRNSCR